MHETRPMEKELKMKENNKMSLRHKWLWWKKGECVVEILHTGHFPTTVMAKLPNDHITEIDLDELEFPKDQ